MKRVCTLYRVSTKGQVDVTKDDIPMQRIACREFAEEHGWQIVIEKVEKGVSGSKVSAYKRDVIQDIKDAAVNKEFDILLVFMFDRLGRIDSETPFVLEWFTKHGIEVWSVNEGQQRMDSHTDKLLNYIRFWQAAGESEKMSVRIKTRLGQMVDEGIFTGGFVPFGYKLEYKGRLNKKGQPARDLVVDPHEAEMVKMIFDKVANEGYGTYQIATVINEKGFKTRNNSNFTATSVLRILKNEMYRGYIVRGGKRSERIPELQLISDSVFEKVQDHLKERITKNNDKCMIAQGNRERNLLSGNVYCAHCGCKLASSRRLYSYVRNNGESVKKEQGTYVCYHKSRGLSDCDGATTYLSEKVDDKVRSRLYDMFANITYFPEKEVAIKAFRKTLNETVRRRKFLENELKKCQNDLNALYLDLPDTIVGSNGIDPADLSAALDYAKGRISFVEREYNKARQLEDEKTIISKKLNEAYDLLVTWSEQFDYISHTGQKTIINNLFERIEIGKGYTVKMIMSEEYRYFFDQHNWEILL